MGFFFSIDKTKQGQFGGDDNMTTKSKTFVQCKLIKVRELQNVSFREYYFPKMNVKVSFFRRYYGACTKLTFAAQ